MRLFFLIGIFITTVEEEINTMDSKKVPSPKLSDRNSTINQERAISIWRSLEGIFGEDIKYSDKDPYVAVMIRDSECYSADTESSFIVYLVTLDFHSNFLSAVHIRSDKFIYHRLSSSRRFMGWLSAKPVQEEFKTLDQCFQEGRIDCVPRADAVFIRFENEPYDPWSIDEIEVDVGFRLGVSEEQWYHWHFEHAVLLPCSSWMREAKTYQIGPRNGLFITHPYLYTPKVEERVRDWV